MAMSDTGPLLLAPTGELIDGRRLLAEAVGFGRALRAAGLSVDLGAAIDFARALALPGVDIGRKAVVRDTGAALFVRRRDDREVYDRVFEQFWRRRGRRLPTTRIEGVEKIVDRRIYAPLDSRGPIHEAPIRAAPGDLRVERPQQTPTRRVDRNRLVRGRVGV